MKFITYEHKLRLRGVSGGLIPGYFVPLRGGEEMKRVQVITELLKVQC
jgi:hypothetical protein